MDQATRDQLLFLQTKLGWMEYYARKSRELRGKRYYLLMRLHRRKQREVAQ